MARLILLFLILAAIAIVVTSIERMISRTAGATAPPKGQILGDLPMPGAVQMIAYVLLVLLMFGVATGLIGGL